MEAKAILRYLRIAPRKVRMIANEIKGKYIGEALSILSFIRKRGAKHLMKLIRSAMHNIKQKGGKNIDYFYIKNLTVDEGPMWKRYIPRAMGRATKIRKRTSHLTLILSDE